MVGVSEDNLRYRENMDRIKNGKILEVAEVVKNLAHKSSDKGLSAGEKKLYNNAKQILNESNIKEKMTGEKNIELFCGCRTEVGVCSKTILPSLSRTCDTR